MAGGAGGNVARRHRRTCTALRPPSSRKDRLRGRRASAPRKRPRRRRNPDRTSARRSGYMIALMRLLRLEHRELLAHVGGVLAGEVRPFRIAAVAIHAVAGGADGGLGGAGFGGAHDCVARQRRPIGEAQRHANERGGQAQRKSALNHGLAGSLEGGELYTSVCRLNVASHEPVSQCPLPAVGGE